MNGKLVEVAKGRNVLLFDEGDLQETIKPGTRTAAGASSSRVDPVLEAGINRYLQKESSSSSQRSNKGVQPQLEEEHTGITDDEDDGREDGEPDYEVFGRMTLKASNQALAEVMAEAKGLSVGKTKSPAKAPVPKAPLKPSPAKKP